jgi:ribonuclease D
MGRGLDADCRQQVGWPARIETSPHVSHWISDPAELRTRLGAAPPRIGLDTEFVRERTWWPQLALVQVSLDDGGILLADAQAPGIPEALAPVLADTSVLKVMHSASEDLVALKHACGVVPTPLFDTQVAAALAGIGAGVGYQRLVQDRLGVALPKGETRSDWMRRPLSPAQLEYAADDVLHLFALQDDLEARLAALGRLDWLREDCARMVANAASDELERWPHLALRSAQFLDGAGQLRLLRLLRWRDAYARGADRPRGWIMDNELATSLARNPPPDRAALQRQLEATPKAPRNLGDAVWQALATPLADEAGAPQARNEDRDKGALRALQDVVSAASAELGLPDGVLASRRWLQSLVEHRARGDAAWPGPLAGWRRGLLEPRLAPLLGRAGDASAASV